jgi:hypothetical protein
VDRHQDLLVNSVAFYDMGVERMKYRWYFFVICMLFCVGLPLKSYSHGRYGASGLIDFEITNTFYNTSPLGKWDFPTFTGTKVNDYDGVPDGGSILNLGPSTENFGYGDVPVYWNGVTGWNGENALAFSYEGYDCYNWGSGPCTNNDYYSESYYPYYYGDGFPILPERIEIPVPFATSMTMLIGGINYCDWCSFTGSCSVCDRDVVPPQVVLVAKDIFDHVITSQTLELSSEMQEVTLDWYFNQSNGIALPIAKIGIRALDQFGDPEDDLNPYFLLIDDVQFDLAMNRTDLSQTKTLLTDFEIPTNFEDAAPLREFELVKFSSLAGTLDGGAVLPATPEYIPASLPPRVEARGEGNNVLAFDCNASLKYGSSLGIRSRPVLPERITFPMHPEDWVAYVSFNVKSRMDVNGEYPDSGKSIQIDAYAINSTLLSSKIVTLDSTWRTVELSKWDICDCDDYNIHHIDIYPSDVVPSAPTPAAKSPRAKKSVPIPPAAAAQNIGPCSFEIDNIEFSRPM